CRVVGQKADDLRAVRAEPLSAAVVESGPEQEQPVFHPRILTQSGTPLGSDSRWWYTYRHEAVPRPAPAHSRPWRAPGRSNGYRDDIDLRRPGPLRSARRVSAGYDQEGAVRRGGARASVVLARVDQHQRR